MRTLAQIKKSIEEIKSSISHKYNEFNQQMEPLRQHLKQLEEEESQCSENILMFFNVQMIDKFNELIKNIKFLKRDSYSPEEGLTNVNYYFSFKNDDKIFGLEGEYNSWSERIGFFYGIKLEKCNSLKNGSVIPRQDLELTDISFYSLIKGLDKNEVKISYLLAKMEKNEYEK